MLHQELRRRIPNANTAVLLLHGIAGSPAHFRSLIDLEGAVPGEYSFYNLCYPGHGGSVKEFGESSMRAWKQYALDAFLELAESHRQVILVGHSMGALFALELAAQFPQKISGVMLLQCPLFVGLRWFGVKNLICLPFGRVSQNNAYGAAMQLACGMKLEKNFLKYVRWLPRLGELLRQMRRIRTDLPGVKIPVTAFSSGRDELVSCRSGGLLRQCGVEVVDLPESSHFYYTDEDKAKILERFSQLLKENALP